MRNKEEIKKYLEGLETIISDEVRYHLAFNPKGFNELNDKFKEIKNKYRIINENQSKNEEELNILLKEKKKSYGEGNQSSEIKGEILGLKWILGIINY